MNQDRPSAAAVERHSPLEPVRLLDNPLFDKFMAVLACTPFLFVLWLNLSAHSFDIPRIVLVLNILLQVGPMFARRPPVKVTQNLAFWLFSFITTYWAFAAAVLAPPGRALTPAWVTTGLSVLSLVLLAYARLSLGRNIGIVPALRQLVIHGAYRYVRHPIYTGTFLVYLGVALSSFSWFNSVLCLTGCLLYMIKSLIEERFLGGDPAYREYMRRVRWRWLPGIA